MANRHPLEQKVRRLRRRLWGIETLHRVLRCLIAASAATLLVLLVQRLLVNELDVWLIASVLGGLSLAAGVIWSIVRRPSIASAAVAVDERLNLRERISSGLCMVHSARRMEQAVVEDAELHAQDLRAGEAFPYPVFREYRYLAAIVALIAAAHFFLPPMQLTAGPSAKSKPDIAKPLAAEQAKKASEELKALKEQLAERTETSDPLQLQDVEKNLEQLQRQLEMKKLEQNEALAKVSKLTDQLQQKKEGVESKLRDFQDLMPPENLKFTKDIAKDMQSGRFGEAGKKISDLKAQMEQGKLSEQDKKQLAQEMKKLAEQLKENPELAQSLKDAGEKMDQGSMNEAMQNMDMANESLAELAESMKQMKMLDQLEEKLGECKSGICQGSALAQGEGEGQGKGDQWRTSDQLSKEWGAGEELKRGSGMGKAGRGMGGQAQVAQDTFTLTPDKAKSEMQKGKILSLTRVEGEQIRGESNIQFDEAMVEYSQMAEDTLDREPMPKEYKNLVRDYFDSIRPDTNPPAATPTPAGE